MADPRSQSQPDGVDGPSEVVDHGAFVWTDGDWRGFRLEEAILYELHVGTFDDGSFAGVARRLPELKALGVGAIELMPLASFDGGRGWGYDGSFPFSVHQEYGGPQELKALVNAAHSHGIGVILDIVYNHFGPTGTVLTEFGPYLNKTSDTPWGHAVNFDGEDSHEVRRFVVDNASYWLNAYHIDGLRLDAVHAILDNSEVSILSELEAAVSRCSQAAGRRLWLIAEHEDTEEALVAPASQGGIGMDAVWNDPVHHAIHAAVTGERFGYYRPWGSIGQVAASLEARSPGDDGAATNRSVGPCPSQFVSFSQNHDQIGNRPKGDRLSTIVGVDAAITAAALILLGPGTPLVFMGEEWAASTPFPYFCGPRNTELDEAVRQGRRREFPAVASDESADPLTEATFVSACLDWEERDQEPHSSALALFSRLIALRKLWPDLGSDAPTQVRYDESRRWLVMKRGRIDVVTNLGIEPIDLVRTGIQLPLTDGKKNGPFALPPWSFMVIGPGPDSRTILLRSD